MVSGTHTSRSVHEKNKEQQRGLLTDSMSAGDAVANDFRAFISIQVLIKQVTLMQTGLTLFTGIDLNVS